MRELMIMWLLLLSNNLLRCIKVIVGGYNDGSGVWCIAKSVFQHTFHGQPDDETLDVMNARDGAVPEL